VADQRDTDAQVVERWLASGQTVRISGMDLAPVPHPVLPTAPHCVVKGQASVFFLKQHPHGHVWLLKKFAPSRRPSDEYLGAVTRRLPGGAGFFTCTQRRLLTAKHLDWWQSGFKDRALPGWLEGTILMPKVPGAAWASVADDLRDGSAALTLNDRLTASLSLVGCIERLEAASCCHRDLSSLNVFIAPNGRVYLIDFDSLYHPALPFQPNTTAGTMGYIAPFTRGAAGLWEAPLSWCAGADRFALAVLIAEFLLVGPDSPPPREDGSLFAQAELDPPETGSVQHHIECLAKTSEDCAALLGQTLAATSFETCPPPQEWRSALQRALRVERVRRETGGAEEALARWFKLPCFRCGRTAWIDGARWHELRARQKDVLCSPCLQAELSQRAAAQRERDWAFPEVSCEHCNDPLRLERGKLELLRTQGKPILCRECLSDQMGRWAVEREALDRDCPKTPCGQCGRTFRLRKDKLDGLVARGKRVLCSECLRVALSSRASPPSANGRETRRSVACGHSGLIEAIKSLLG